MGSLIVIVVAAVLLWFDILSAGVYIAITVISTVWIGIGAALYMRVGLFKFFYHDLLGWHQPAYGILWHDGCSKHSVCRYCERDIMQDSQGNWFLKECEYDL